MKIVLFASEAGGKAESGSGSLGSLHGDRIVDLQRAYLRLHREKRGVEASPGSLSPSTLADLAAFIGAGERGLDEARAAQDYVLGEGGDDGETVLSLSDVRLLAPSPGPATRIPCAGGNFAAHLAGVQASLKGEAPSIESVFE